MARDFLVWVTDEFVGFPDDAYEYLTLIERVYTLANGDVCLRITTNKDFYNLKQLFELLDDWASVYMVEKWNKLASPDWSESWDVIEAKMFWDALEPMHIFGLAGMVME